MGSGLLPKAISHLFQARLNDPNCQQGRKNPGNEVLHHGKEMKEKREEKKKGGGGNNPSQIFSVNKFHFASKMFANYLSGQIFHIPGQTIAERPLRSACPETVSTVSRGAASCRSRGLLQRCSFAVIFGSGDSGSLFSSPGGRCSGALHAFMCLYLPFLPPSHPPSLPYTPSELECSSPASWFSYQYSRASSSV